MYDKLTQSGRRYADNPPQHNLITYDFYHGENSRENKKNEPMRNKSDAIQTMFSDLARLNEVERDRTYRLLSGKSKEKSKVEISAIDQSAKGSVTNLDQNPAAKLSIKFLSTKAEASLVDKFARNVIPMSKSATHRL